MGLLKVNFKLIEQLKLQSVGWGLHCTRLLDHAWYEDYSF